jgi:hypothetical protein
MLEGFFFSSFINNLWPKHLGIDIP